jgi:2-polyprenyl-6-methoxyphenol hydroxylase-like FAD-dependent oxidoreductase
MELVRSWGLEAEVRGDAIDVEWLGWMGDTLASPTGSALPVGFPTRHQSALISPTGTACVSQGHLEAVLLAHLRSLPAARVELGTALTVVEPGPDAVTVTLEGGRTVRARHVVGADGIRSTVRAALGTGAFGRPERVAAGRRRGAARGPRRAHPASVARRRAVDSRSRRERVDGVSRVPVGRQSGTV